MSLERINKHLQGKVNALEKENICLKKRLHKLSAIHRQTLQTHKLREEEWRRSRRDSAVREKKRTSVHADVFTTNPRSSSRKNIPKQYIDSEKENVPSRLQAKRPENYRTTSSGRSLLSIHVNRKQHDLNQNTQKAKKASTLQLGKSSGHYKRKYQEVVKHVHLLHEGSGSRDRLGHRREFFLDVPEIEDVWQNFTSQTKPAPSSPNEVPETQNVLSIAETSTTSFFHEHTEDEQTKPSMLTNSDILSKPDILHVTPTKHRGQDECTQSWSRDEACSPCLLEDQETPKQPEDQTEMRQSTRTEPKNRNRETKYVDVVRGKQNRASLTAVSCYECKEFYETLVLQGIMTRKKMEELLQDGSRHRHRYLPPQTPDGYWSIPEFSESAQSI